MNFKSNFLLFICLSLFVFFGCASNTQDIGTQKSETKLKAQNEPIEDHPARQFMNTHALGRRITSQIAFDDFLAKLPDYFIDNTPKSRVYLTRIDDLPIGNTYNVLDQWDMALETGLIDGLIANGLTIAEKLDHVNPRDPSEYIGTVPQDAFYMHGINLDDLKLIKEDFKAPYLMTYQIMDFSKDYLSVAIYLRMIDISSMKVISSALIKVGDIFSHSAQTEINAYEDIYNIVKNIFDFPGYIFNKDISIGLMNSDILNISGKYKNEPSRKSIAIENAIVSGITQNGDYDQDIPVIMEKTKGFKLKFPSVYNSIVFNTNPILYEDWTEFIDETNCSILMMYRYMPNNGLYLKLIDTKDNGRIIYSNAFPFRSAESKGIINNHYVVNELLKHHIDTSFFSDKKLMIIDGDKQAVASDEYFNNQPTFNEMNLIVEEGLITALVSQDVPLYEKLKTLYLKRPWMYDEKVFNLNPLYLNDWSQLKDFGVETLMVYNNLMPYEKMSPSDPDYQKIAMGIRIIDVSTGDILKVIEITNLN